MATRKRKSKRTRKTSRARKSPRRRVAGPKYRNPLAKLSVKILAGKRKKCEKELARVDDALAEKGKREIHKAIIEGMTAHAEAPRKKQLHLPNPWGA